MQLQLVRKLQDQERQRDRRARASPSDAVSHPPDLRAVAQRLRTLSSCSLFMRERPLMPRWRASLRSWSYVLPPEPWCERRPPRRPEEISSTDVRLACLVSP